MDAGVPTGEDLFLSGLLLLTGLIRYRAAKFCTVDPLKLVFVGLLLELTWFVIL